MSDLELQQLFDNTFDCYTYYEDDSMEEVQEPAMTKATFVAEVFKLLRKQANDFRTENRKCAIPDVSQQRELLKNFLDWSDGRWLSTPRTEQYDEMFDEFFNCG